MILNQKHKMDSNGFTVLAAAWGRKAATWMPVQCVNKEKMKKIVAIVLRGSVLTCFDAASTTKAGVSKRSMKGTSRKTHLRVQTLGCPKTHSSKLKPQPESVMLCFTLNMNIYNGRQCCYT